MAAGGTPTNVQLGPGRLYVAAIGTTEPASSSAALPSAWRAVGYTEDGNAFSTETTSEPVEVAEELDPVAYANTRRISRVAFTMAETTRRNLALAMNVGANEANDATAFEPPDLGTEVRIMLVWDSDEDPTATPTTNRRWLFRRGYQSGAIEVPHRKAPAKSLIAVTFNLEKPTGAKVFKAFPNAAGLI